ncbi:MAG: N-acyl homoserine lactonase family protein [Gammaproteobacteria bacterium]
MKGLRDIAAAALAATVLSGIPLLAIAELRLYVFDCGSLTFSDVTPFGLTNEETAVRELFVPCYLIDHDGTQMIWDAGLPDGIAGQGDIDDGSGMVMRMDRRLPENLALVGLTPADIDVVAFSHMHFDHVGAANLFTNAHLLIQDAEYQAAFIDQDNPVFPAPGHTPGHQALLLHLVNTGPLVLSGDLYHFAESRTLRRAPQFNTDAEAAFRSMDKVEDLIRQEGATLWIEHEKALADTLNLAPAYYD